MKIYNRITALLLIPVMAVSAFILPAKAYEENYVNHWACKETEFLIEKGIVTGYTDGSIKPDDYITTGECEYLVSGIMNYCQNSLHNKFNALENYSKIKDLISELSLHNEYISRWDFSKICLAVMNEYGNDSDLTSDACNTGLIIGYPDGELKMENMLTRAEAFVITYRMLNTMQKQEPDEERLPAYFLPGISKNEDINTDEKDINEENSDDTGLDNNGESNNSRNMPPTKPVIILDTDSTEIINGDYVRVTAESEDPEGDEITYIWENRDSEYMIYHLGDNVVRVKAVDSNGNESEWTERKITVVNMEGNLRNEYITEEHYEYEYEAPSNGYIKTYYIFADELEGGEQNCSAMVEVWDKDNESWISVYEENNINGVDHNGILEYGKYTKIRYTYNMPDYYLAEDLTVTVSTQVYTQ